jgi:hypothetical protein
LCKFIENIDNRSIYLSKVPNNKTELSAKYILICLMKKTDIVKYLYRLRNCVQKDLVFFSNLEAIVLTCYGLLFTKLYTMCINVNINVIQHDDRL